MVRRPGTGWPRRTSPALGRVQRRPDLAQQPVQPAELALVDLDRGREELQPHGPLVDQSRERLEHRVEPAQLPQRDQRPPVGRVLPRPELIPGRGVRARTGRSGIADILPCGGIVRGRKQSAAERTCFQPRISRRMRQLKRESTRPAGPGSSCAGRGQEEGAAADAEHARATRRRSRRSPGRGRSTRAHGRGSAPRAGRPAAGSPVGWSRRRTRPRPGDGIEQVRLADQACRAGRTPAGCTGGRQARVELQTRTHAGLLRRATSSSARARTSRTKGTPVQPLRSTTRPERVSVQARRERHLERHRRPNAQSSRRRSSSKSARYGDGARHAVDDLHLVPQNRSRLTVDRPSRPMSRQPPSTTGTGSGSPSASRPVEEVRPASAAEAQGHRPGRRRAARWQRLLEDPLLDAVGSDARRSTLLTTPCRRPPA